MDKVSTHFGLSKWPIVSQHPQIAPVDERKHAERVYLPLLIRLWQLIESGTGYRWKSTSYWRNSPSHRRGYALDIAPDVAPSAAMAYAVSKRSDPVLYKRTALIRALQRVAQNNALPGYTAGIFIEPDHLHLHLFPPTPGPKIRVAKWKVPKESYPDTLERMKLPMLP